MDRMCLTDAQWAKMPPHCKGKVTDPGRTGGDGRLFSGSGVVDRPDWQPVAGLAAGVREVEHGVQALARLGKSRCFQTDFRSRVGGSRHGICHG